MAQSAASKQIRLTASHPIFLVNDVVKSAEWYRDVLGFQFNRFWGEPPCFCIVRRDNVEIFLKGPECPGETVTVRSNRSHKSMWDTVYEMREFEVEDINGYGLCFAHDTSGTSQ